jgi:penicillin-binding protein 2
MLTFRRLLRPRKRGFEIDPDEIFLDASNLPSFDEHQFEGRLERAIPKRTIFLFGACAALLAVLLIGKLFSLQILEGSTYAAQARENRLDHTIVFAERGVIYDKNGVRLVWNERDLEDDFAHRIYYGEGGLSHLLGYVSYPKADSKGIYYDEYVRGLDGIEKLHDSVLLGDNGRKIIELDATLHTQSESVFDRPRDGGDITLSIDAPLQEKLYELIKARAEESGFQGGGGVILDVATGDILALTSYPAYDSSAIAQGHASTVEAYQTDTRTPFLNRVVSGLYTPGSIIKPFIAVGALEEGVISPSKEILSTGSLTLQNPYNPSHASIFRDWKAHGYVDLRRALAVSSNVYFFEIGGGFGEQEGLGITRIEKYVRAFGLGSPTELLIAPEPEGTIPNPAWKYSLFNDDWRLGDTYNTAIGQYGFQVTPLQVVSAIAALANGGFLPRPSLLSTDPVERQRLNVSESTLALVREGMRAAVTEGTATGLNVPGVSVAAKTGTAELGARKEFVHSWVVGFFPYEKPRYAFAVIMERGPRENLLGGVSVMNPLLHWLIKERPEYVSAEGVEP